MGAEHKSGPPQDFEFSSISRQVLLGVDGRLNVGVLAGDLDQYSVPIVKKMKDDQPLLFDYLGVRSRAAAKYRRSLMATTGYMHGSALGYDIMVSHLASRGREVDVPLLHISAHDLAYGMALSYVIGGEAGKGEKLLDQRWFHDTWITDSFEGSILPRPGRKALEFSAFVDQVANAPVFRDYLHHIALLMRNDETVVKQGVITGVFDQTMIYHRRLQDADSPDVRYEIGPDGKKIMGVSPTDRYVAQNPPFFKSQR